MIDNQGINFSGIIKGHYYIKVNYHPSRMSFPKTNSALIFHTLQFQGSGQKMKHQLQSNESPITTHSQPIAVLNYAHYEAHT